MTDRGKLGEFLREVINWDWADFCIAEKSPDYSGYQSTVFSLVRVAGDGKKLGAIKLSIDRVDGKLDTPVKVEYPKIYFVYPEAKSVALPSGPLPPSLPNPDSSNLPPIDTEDAKENVVTSSLRDTLHKLADSPRITTQLIIDRKRQVEADPESFKNVNEDDVSLKVPLVKSVIAANLLNLVERNNFEAISEVFDQIDGKLVETIRILGDDIFLTQYSLEAPAGAVKNKDGIYMLEMPAIGDIWKAKFENK